MKKYYTLIAAAAAMALAFGSCTEEDPVPPLPTDFEEDVIAGEDDTDEPDEEEPGGTPAAPDEEGNFIHDSGFGEATLANALYSETLVYNEWLYYVADTYNGKFTLEITDDAERGRVGKMTNAGTAIPNSDPGRSFFCQMIEGTMDPGLYTISFKAKAASGPAKTRIFIRTTDADGKPAATYFPFYSGKPASDDSKYTAYCKNCPEATPTEANPPLSTEEWMEFEFIIDLSKVVPTGSVAYSSAAASTETDRTGILVCLQNNAANSAMLIDDVTLAKYTEESSSETEN